MSVPPATELAIAPAHLVDASTPSVTRETAPSAPATGAATAPTIPLAIPATNPANPSSFAPSAGRSIKPVMPALMVS